jgi:hypothetical protein
MSGAQSGADGGPARISAASAPRVLVLSYYQYQNFGDRLGYHVVNGLLPARAIVTHASLASSDYPAGQFDLLILGTGHSLNASTIRRPELHRLLDRVPHSIGIFGTQYHYQYRDLMDPGLFGAMLDKLTTWWARYASDIAHFGEGRANVRHLGDCLISAFPMTVPILDKALLVPPEIVKKELSLDRTIQKIQAYRQVRTARLHPLLCALTSAEEVAYHEQREGPQQGQPSGKFAAQLEDVFGRTFPEGEFFKVDRDAVLRYKVKVEANLAALKAQIQTLLA